MSDLDKYIVNRKKKDKQFAEGFDEGYEQFLKKGIIGFSFIHVEIIRVVCKRETA